MPCGKEKVFQANPEEKDKLIQNVLNDKLFSFFQVDIEVPEQLLDKFSEFSPLFILSEVREDQIPQHMQDYKINTGRKKIKNNKKLLGVMKAEKILLYSPLLKWYLNHGLQVTKITEISERIYLCLDSVWHLQPGIKILFESRWKSLENQLLGSER